MTQPFQYKQIFTVTINPAPGWQAVPHALGIRPDHVQVHQRSGNSPLKVSDGLGMGDPPPTATQFFVKYTGTVPATVTFLVEYWHSISAFLRPLAAHSMIVTYSGASGFANEYLDVRLLPWDQWQPIPIHTAPCDANGWLNDPDQMKPSLAIFEDGLTGNAQHIDAFCLDYPPYQGDMIRVGARDSTGGPGNNIGSPAWIGLPWSRSTIVLVYHNDIPVPFLHDWDVPAHTLTLKLSTGDRTVLVPRLLIPPLTRRVLWVMSNNTVIGADSIQEPQASENGLGAYPLRVDPGLGIWCPPRKFLYSAPGPFFETVAPSWWLQQGVNSVCAARTSVERNLVTGVVGKDAALFALLNYNQPNNDKFVLAAEARAQKYDGVDPIATFSRLTAVADAFCAPIGAGPTAAALITPPAGNQPFSVLWGIPASLMGSQPPPEIEFRLKRLGEDVQDVASSVDFLGGGILGWFRSPYTGPGL